MGTVLGKETLPAGRAGGSQAGVGVCEPRSHHNSQHPPCVAASCCPLSCGRLPVSLMKKQKLHISFSEVRADLTQPPGPSISPRSHHLHHLKNPQFLPPSAQNLDRSLLGAVRRDPHQPRLRPFSFPPSQLRDGQRDAVCPGWKAEDLPPQLPAPKLPRAVGTAAPQSLGVPWLKCTRSLQHISPISVGKLRHRGVVGSHGRSAELLAGLRYPGLELLEAPRPL